MGINTTGKDIWHTDFEKTFRQRTQEGWASFLAGEAKLRQYVDENRDSEEIISVCTELLEPAFYDVAFEVGFNGEKHELILTPDGSKAKLFPLLYFKNYAPEEVLEHWNILIGRQPAKSEAFVLKMYGVDVSGEDIFVWAKRESDTVKLTVYCEKILPLLKEDEDKAYWFMYVMLDEIIGEIASMRYIDGLELVTEPLAGESMILNQLPEYLSSAFAEQDGDIQDAAGYINRYTCYEMQPAKEEDMTVRRDVYVGVTNCVPIINEYLHDENYAIDNFHHDGIEAGFFCYPLNSFTGENRGKEILDFRDSIESAVLKQAGEEAVTFIGGASGVYYGYLDFIAWDIDAVFQAASDIFEETSLEWVEFYSFKKDAACVVLKEENEIPSCH